MQNVGNELRNIAMTKVAQAYLCHRAKSQLITLSKTMPLDPLLQDLWLMLQTPKIYVKEGARDLNVRLDGELTIAPGYYHHTRRHGLLTVYESILFSHKIESYLRQELYTEIARNRGRSAAKLIEDWGDKLDLDPSWSEKTIRTYRNHRKGEYPGISVIAA